MMKGIVERPIAVVVHLRMGRGHFVVLPSRYSDAAHTRLMVKPGMMTEAKACHTNVSTTATATRVVFPGLSPWALRNRRRVRYAGFQTCRVIKSCDQNLDFFLVFLFFRHGQPQSVTLYFFKKTNQTLIIMSKHKWFLTTAAFFPLSTASAVTYAVATA